MSWDHFQKNFQKKFDVMIIAHTGASFEAPGNTIRAFELAVDAGAEMIEFDDHNTIDDHIVVIHDRTTERTSDINIDILTWILLLVYHDYRLESSLQLIKEKLVLQSNRFFSFYHPLWFKNLTRSKTSSNCLISGIEYSSAVLAVVISARRLLKYLRLSVSMVLELSLGRCNRRSWFFATLRGGSANLPWGNWGFVIP